MHTLPYSSTTPSSMRASCLGQLFFSNPACTPSLNVVAPSPRKTCRCSLPLAQVVDQAHILREAFAPTTNLSPLHIPMKTTPRQVATATYDAVARAMHTICVLVVCMDGGDVSREDRVRVRVSLAGDPDDWRENEQFSRATNPSAVSGVGVVDEEAAVCRWHVPGGSTREVRDCNSLFPVIETLQ